MIAAALHPPSGHAPPGVGAVVRRLDDDATIAWWAEAPLVGPASSAIEAVVSHPDAPPLIVTWSGGLGDSLFERSARTWMPSGRDALAAACARIAPTLERAGRRLLLRTHCRHALSDAPGCVAFARERAGGPIGLAFDPASMFEASMLAGADEHLDRLFQMVAAHAEAIVLMNVGRPANDDPDAPPPVARAGEGALDVGLLSRLVREHAPPDGLIIGAGPDPLGMLGAVGLADDATT